VIFFVPRGRPVGAIIATFAVACMRAMPRTSVALARGGRGMMPRRE